jgi:hypothetical protein
VPFTFSKKTPLAEQHLALGDSPAAPARFSDNMVISVDPRDSSL